MSDPISWRNRNPGNIRGQYFGAIGNRGGFAVYPSMEAGWDAMEKQLDRYYQGKTTGVPLQSIRDIISVWAPSSENDVNAYVSRISQDLGINPDQPLPWTPETKRSLMSSMATYEAGLPTIHPEGMTIQASQLTGDPSVYEGEIMNISAQVPAAIGAAQSTGMNPMPTAPALPAMPTMPALPEPGPMDYISAGLANLAGAFGGQSSPMGVAVASNLLGGYGNDLARYELMQRMQSDRYAMEMERWKAVNQQREQQQARLDRQRQMQWAMGAEARKLQAQREQQEQHRRALIDAGVPSDVAALESVGASDAIIKSVMRQNQMRYGSGYNLPPELEQAVMTGDMEPSEALKEHRTREQDRLNRIESTTDDFLRETEEERQRLIGWENVADYDPYTITGAQELVLINAFAKMIDPTSYVAEGEARTVSEAGAKFKWLPEWMRSVIKQNKRLDPPQVASLLTEMQEQASRSYDRLTKTRDRFDTRLRRLGVDATEEYLSAIEAFNRADYLPLRGKEDTKLPPGIPPGSRRGIDEYGDEIWRAPDGTLHVPD